MYEIVIVGLGPGAPGHLTREAWGVLSTTSEIWLRTAHHPVVTDLPEEIVIHTFDDYYEKADSFPEVYAAIADQVLRLAAAQDVVYAVPGHPLVGEAAVRQILAQAKERGIATRLVDGLSFIEPTLSALQVVDALDGVMIVDAMEVMGDHYPPLNPAHPVLVAQVYSRHIASELKLTLMAQYPDDHNVALVSGAGTSAQHVTWRPLYAIDRKPLGLLTSLYVPALPEDVSFENFQATIARLRSPSGCPWDREQTHESLRTNLLEETYEVLETIDVGDTAALQEELGDLLLQIVLHAQIAHECGEFHMADVLAGIDQKLKRRHPHVWGDVDVTGADEVTLNWEALKRNEREENGTPDKSLLDGVPTALPALAQAYAYLDRARRVGFDWPNLEAVIAQVQEELEEVREAASATERFHELGDLLLAVANWARWLDVDPESALRKANQRFAQRFCHVERTVHQQGYQVSDLEPAQLLRFWQEAKEKTRS
jgi:tetrapyrrole methylase family protein/MazG family protein